MVFWSLPEAAEVLDEETNSVVSIAVPPFFFNKKFRIMYMYNIEPNKMCAATNNVSLEEEHLSNET